MRRRLLGVPLVLLAGAAGAGLQYFFDPERGRTRRVQTKDQAAAAVRRRTRRLQRRADQTAQYARDRAKGIAHEVSQPPSAEVPDNDRTLADKVRSEVLGRPEFSGYTINVDAVEGVVTLRGQVDRPEEIVALREAVADVPGVQRVEDFLHLPGTPAPNL